MRGKYTGHQIHLYKTVRDIIEAASEEEELDALDFEDILERIPDNIIVQYNKDYGRGRAVLDGCLELLVTPSAIVATAVSFRLGEFESIMGVLPLYQELEIIDYITEGEE